MPVLDDSALLRDAVSRLQQEGRAALVAAWRYDPASGRLELKARAGEAAAPPGPWARIVLASDNGPVAEAARLRRPVVRHRLSAHLDAEWAARERIASLVAAPLVASGELYGALVCCTRESRTDDDAARLARFADATAAALEERVLRERAAVAPDASLRRYRLLGEAMPLLAWLAGADGSLEWVNGRWFDYAGVRLDELARARFASVVHPDDLPSFAARRHEAEGRGEAWDAEVRLRRADGSWRWHQLRAAPAGDEPGAPGGWVGTAADVHARRTQEETARFVDDAGRRLAGTLETAEILGSVADLVVPRLADWCAIHALEDGAVKLAAVVHRDPARAAEVRALLEAAPPALSDGLGAGQALRTGKREHYAVRADGGCPLARLGVREAAVLPLTDGTRASAAMTLAVTGADRSLGPVEMALAEDVGARASVALEAARRYREARDGVLAREELLAIASHELKTPLSSLQGYLQILLRNARQKASPAPSDLLGAMVENAERQSKRLLKLINNLLDASRLAGGPPELELEEVDLALVAREVAARFAAEFVRAGCSFTLACPGPVVGRWDRLRVEQVVTNLLSNAVKYGEGAPVEMTVEAVGAAARLTLRDHGIGIAREHQARVFERFQRAGPPGGNGLGLGLYIVRQLVEAHGGLVQLESEEGAGTTFVVELPLGAASRQSG